MRSMFNGAIILGGLFCIPSKLVKATEEHDVRFHEYHATDNGRVGRSKPCKLCGTILSEEDIIKGVEISKGKVVTFTKPELENLPLASAKNIIVERFVDGSELNSVMMDTTYYVLPNPELGLAQFQLFVKALAKSGKVAIAKIALRQREHLCALTPNGDGLLLNTMLYADEIREMPTSPVSQTNDKELGMLCQYIKNATKPFDHSIYVDEYNDALQKLVDLKIAGEEIPISDETPAKPTQNIEDALNALIKQSKEATS